MRRLYRNEKRYYRFLKKEKERTNVRIYAISFSSASFPVSRISSRESSSISFSFLGKGRRSTSVGCIHVLRGEIMQGCYFANRSLFFLSLFLRPLISLIREDLLIDCRIIFLSLILTARIGETIS